MADIGIIELQPVVQADIGIIELQPVVQALLQDMVTRGELLPEHYTEIINN